MGVYAERYGFTRVLLLFSQGLDVRLMGRLTASLRSRNIQVLQGQNSKRIASLFDTTGFWRLIASDPFDRAEWLGRGTKDPQREHLAPARVEPLRPLPAGRALPACARNPRSRVGAETFGCS